MLLNLRTFFKVQVQRMVRTVDRVVELVQAGYARIYSIVHRFEQLAYTAFAVRSIRRRVFAAVLLSSDRAGVLGLVRCQRGGVFVDKEREQAVSHIGLRYGVQEQEPLPCPGLPHPLIGHE
jgi:hypothetical protein